MAACAKLDPPIKSQNWISCTSLDHVFYLNKYGMLFKPLHGFTRSIDSPMAYCCLPWIGSANVGSTSFLLNCCFSKLLSLSSQVFTRTKRNTLTHTCAIYIPTSFLGCTLQCGSESLQMQGRSCWMRSCHSWSMISFHTWTLKSLVSCYCHKLVLF